MSGAVASVFKLCFGPAMSIERAGLPTKDKALLDAELSGGMRHQCSVRSTVMQDVIGRTFVGAPLAKAAKDAHWESPLAVGSSPSLY